ncbi:MAG TPA: hypothetical protein PLL26_04415 [Candidatus Dojkabacteria bacterium]|nr:hypothetical protein [Candidatus Dojkabacteria bacterium]
MNVENILKDYLLKNIRFFNKIPPDNSHFLKLSQKLGLNYSNILRFSGEDVYNNRFETVMMFMLQNYVLKNNSKPINNQFIELLLSNPDLIIRLRQKWEYNCHHFAVLSPFFPINIGKSIQDQIDDYLNSRAQVDIFSKKNRYPNLFMTIRKIVKKGGKIVEFGCASGENLLSLSDHFVQKDGVDIKNLDEILKNKLFQSVDTQNKDIPIHEHLNLLSSNKINIHKGSMFDRKLIHKLTYGASRPLVFFIMNSLYPHFHSVKYNVFFKAIIEFNPDIIIIGGRNPSIEMYLPNKDLYTNENFSFIFSCSNGNVKLIDETID